jgi:Transglutaminase-like superfamily
MSSEIKNAHTDTWEHRSDHFHGNNEPMIIPCDPAMRVEGPAEGSVLLSITGSMVLKLNSVSTLIWQILEENRQTKTGMNSADILRHLSRRLEYCLVESVSLLRVREDCESLLQTLVQKRLVRVLVDDSGNTFYAAADNVILSRGVGRTTSESTVDMLSPPLATNDVGEQPQDCATPYKSALNRISKVTTDAIDNNHTTLMAQGAIAIVRPASGVICAPGNSKKITTLFALLGLISYDLLLKIRGFGLIYRILKRWPLRRRNIMDRAGVQEICTCVCSAVDRAQIYYFKQILCLQRSVIITCLLRCYGIPAEMVVAARMMPFQSHAWVEVGGEVVSDNAEVQMYYNHAIERLCVRFSKPDSAGVI